MAPIVLGFLTLVGVVCALMFGLPQYGVWQQSLSGKAELSRAEYSRQVAVLEAKAKMDAAEDLAQAEITRANGVAKANQIIGESLKNNEAYLRYLWINNLDGKNDKQVIYIPTETGMPVLEAGRLNQLKAQ